MVDPTPFGQLVALCARLRGPGGCPWDREQTLESLRTYILEEAYEVVECLASEDPLGLVWELGDLLFQVIFVAQIAKERGWFDADEVCRRVHAKMVRRHPHVFGDKEVEGAAEVVRNWEAIKQRENGARGVLDGVPRHLPALLKALRVTQKAAAVGFDWERVEDIVAKLREEVEEVAEALVSAPARQRREAIREELGDTLFVVANLARQLDIDPEAALQDANAKFAARFSRMERAAGERGRTLRSLTASELDALWEEAKRLARPAGETSPSDPLESGTAAAENSHRSS